MAFNFLGTFSLGQFDELEKFLKYQEADIPKRISYLQSEIRRTGSLVVTFDTSTGYIEKITASPKNSLVGKLFDAYKLSGGYPEKDLPVRSIDDPIFLPQGSATASAKEFNNKRSLRNSYQYDFYIALIVSSLKEWVLNSIKFKREDIEYKIKKLVDWSDQCAFEILVLEIVAGIESGEVDLSERVSEASKDYVVERQAALAQVQVENPRKKTVVLSSLSEMLQEANSEISSEVHESISKDLADYLGLSAGKPILTMDSKNDIDSDILAVE